MKTALLHYRADGNWSLLPSLLSVLPRIGFPSLGNGFIDGAVELLAEFESDDLFLSCSGLGIGTGIGAGTVGITPGFTLSGSGTIGIFFDN